MKVSSLAGALLAIALGVGLAALSAPMASAQQNVCQPNPSSVDAADPDIIVSSPTAGASVSSPLTVTGQARTFEQTVQLALFDAAGNEIASSFTTATAPDIGVLGPFTGAVSFSVTASTAACLWVFEDSAETGEPINVVQVPLTLQPGLPSTGITGEAAGSPSMWMAGLAVLGAVLTSAGWLLRRRADWLISS